MNKDIVKAWDLHNHKLKEYFKVTPQDEYASYKILLTKTLEFLFVDEDEMPDAKLITEINNGDYQGTLVFVIGGYGYQPSIDNHWYTSVYYGSCSGCDTLQGIRSEGEYDELATDEQVNDYWTLCLHMIQKMKRMNGNEKQA